MVELSNRVMTILDSTYKVNNNIINNNNNSLYFQRVTHLTKKKLIFHETLYKLPPKNNTSTNVQNTKVFEHMGGLLLKAVLINRSYTCADPWEEGRVSGPP